MNQPDRDPEKRRGKAQGEQLEPGGGTVDAAQGEQPPERALFPFVIRDPRVAPFARLFERGKIGVPGKFRDPFAEDRDPAAEIILFGNG